ncbi:uncharacterized protein TRUGW13939_05070 [Talaromyces rugulosus]|uniref:Uncharacterized protein n=1 Tax=Talaromyces rugulosus TaxID=121627 RepID=A0A7H8QVB5_TALRU|nr:uncharacterized protein TRUGW13939_05070 [Talaromyces rugulosus]QKX57950.1 hypothetical protein TRUGW13939_05070 [Talaromyces rugulosus]
MATRTTYVHEHVYYLALAGLIIPGSFEVDVEMCQCTTSAQTTSSSDRIQYRKMNVSARIFYRNDWHRFLVIEAKGFQKDWSPPETRIILISGIKPCIQWVKDGPGANDEPTTLLHSKGPAVPKNRPGVENVDAGPSCGCQDRYRKCGGEGGLCLHTGPEPAAGYLRYLTGDCRNALYFNLINVREGDNVVIGQQRPRRQSGLRTPW